MATSSPHRSPSTVCGTRGRRCARGRRAPKLVQERLGHATIGITLGTYSHVTAGMQRDATDQVAGIIFGAS